MKKILVIICVLVLVSVSGCAGEKESAPTYKYAVEVDGITYYANTVEEIEEIVSAKAENGNTVEEIGKISPEESEIGVEDNGSEEIIRMDYNVTVYDDETVNLVFAYADKKGYHFYIDNKTSEVISIWSEYMRINGGEKMEYPMVSYSIVPGEDGEFCFEVPYSGEEIETITGKFSICNFDGRVTGYVYFKDVELS